MKRYGYLLKAYWQFATKLVFPNLCYICDQHINNPGLCANCFDALVKPANSCLGCGVQLFNLNTNLVVNAQNHYCAKCITNNWYKYFDQLCYAFIYNEPIWYLINSLKNYDNLLLLEFFAQHVLLAFKANINNLNNIDYVTPVPLYWRKLLKRRKNTSAMLALNIAKRLQISYFPFGLRKVKNTQDQMVLSQKERKKNVKGAFNIPQKYRTLLVNKHVLLVDDVLTTGNTVNECAKILKQAGVAKVSVLCIARVEGYLKI